MPELKDNLEHLGAQVIKGHTFGVVYLHWMTPSWHAGYMIHYDEPMMKKPYGVGNSADEAVEDLLDKMGRQ